MKSRIVYLGDGSKRFEIDGRVVTREEFDLHFPNRIKDLLKSRTTLQAHTPAAWPMVSEALGVHPDQIPEAMAADRKRGVASEYTPDGRMIIRDRGQRRDLMKMHNLHDNHGGYGDG